MLALQRTAGNAAVAALLARSAEAPLLQRVVDPRPSFIGIPRYGELLRIFMDAVKAIAPDLWGLIQSEQVVLRLEGAKLDEYANTRVLHEETVMPKKADAKPLRTQELLVDALAEERTRQRMMQGGTKVVIEITFNSDRTKPQPGGGMLETFAHELYAHAEKSVEYIRMARKLIAGKDLEGKEKKKAEVHSRARAYKRDTGEEHRAIASGEDEGLEQRLQGTGAHLAQQHPGTALAEEYARELETDRRGQAKSLRKGRGLGKVYVGLHVFEPEQVAAIVAAARQGLQAFARARKFRPALAVDMLAEFDAKGLRAAKELTDERVHEATSTIRARYGRIALAEREELSKQLAAATSLAQLYGWGESHTTRLISEGALKDGQLVGAGAADERPRTDHSAEYIS